MTTVISVILYPIQWGIAHLLIALHTLIAAMGLGEASDLGWSLTIIALVLCLRLCLLPLTIRQLRAMRRVQALQPELRRIGNAYRGRSDAASREAMQRETMALYRRHRASPFGSCLPTLLQGPILCSLYYLLQALPSIVDGSREPIGPIDASVASHIERSRFINLRLSDTFGTVGPDARATVIATIAVMCLALIATQWLQLHRNTAQEAMAAPQFRAQRIVVFVFPALYVVSGLALPFGVLLYWVSNNCWTLGQTIWQIRMFPTPGSIASERRDRKRHDRENRRRAAQGRPSLEQEAAEQARMAADARREREHRRANGRKRTAGRRGKRGKPGLERSPKRG